MKAVSYHPVKQIFDQGLRPGEEKMKGGDCAIDAVGYQARSDDNRDKENPTQVLENCVRAVNATGSIGMIGVYIAPDPGAKSEHAKKGIFPLLFGFGIIWFGHFIATRTRDAAKARNLSIA